LTKEKILLAPLRAPWPSDTEEEELGPQKVFFECPKLPPQILEGLEE